MGKYHYPKCEKRETMEEYFGVVVKDEYRWLENANDPEVLDWVAKENAYTDAYFDETEVIEKIRELKQINPKPTYASIAKGKDGYYVAKNENGSYVIQYTDECFGKEETLLVKYEIEGFTPYEALPSFTNEKYIAIYGGFAKDNKPSYVILNRDTKEIIKIMKSVWSGVWSKTEDIFYYADSVPNAETKDGATTITALSLDTLEETIVFEDTNNATLPMLHMGSDNTTLMLEMWDDFVHFRFVAIDLRNGVATIVNETAYQWKYIDTVEGCHYFVSKEESETGTVIAIDQRGIDAVKVIRESDEQVVESGFFLKKTLYVITMKNASNRLLCVKDGQSKEVPLPSSICTIDVMSVQEDQVLLSYESFVEAASILSFDGNQMTCRYDSAKRHYQGMKVEQRWAPSTEDKKMIPYFIVYKEGTKRDHNNPVLVYAYGGYNSAMKPWYKDMVSGVVVPDWVEKGGIYVLATLRGGSEFGSKWHEEGMLKQKKNCYYDFIGVCEQLIQDGWTNPKKIGIDGCSNGGLLMSTLITMRPDLFGCVINSVPHTDMLHFAEDDNGPRYITEYGNPKESKEMLEYMLSYSPFHNVKAVAYPAMYLQTGECDNNVPPYHGKKFAAKMQDYSTGEEPLLLRVLKEGAHDRGAGEVYWKTIAEMQLFLEKHLKMKEM